jgi:hypothetical protein
MLHGNPETQQTSPIVSLLANNNCAHECHTAPVEKRLASVRQAFVPVLTKTSSVLFTCSLFFSYFPKQELEIGHGGFISVPPRFSALQYHQLDNNAIYPALLNNL